ncbi:uncharacterized protein BKA78DRAFT_298241 [Phyllosticta capitalensis]|uniref:uncharacterized protein n=1 Tax=Phyllosticta capitalensis TaxID=121624 RepID=UPI00312F4755
MQANDAYLPKESKHLKTEMEQRHDPRKNDPASRPHLPVPLPSECARRIPLTKKNGSPQPPNPRFSNKLAKRQQSNRPTPRYAALHEHVREPAKHEVKRDEMDASAGENL